MNMNFKRAIEHDDHNTVVVDLPKNHFVKAGRVLKFLV